MLEDFVSTLVAERRRSLCPNADLDGYCDRLVELGYSRATIRHKLWIVGTFLAWMAGRKLSIEDLDDGHVAACISSRSKLGGTCHDFRLTLFQLLEHLRESCVVPVPEAIPADDSPLSVLLSRHAEYLRRERAVAECTVTGYSVYARAFVTEHLDGGAKSTALLTAEDTREFLLRHVRKLSPKRAQYMATALRSFLRFLFLRGETETDLSLAVPTVRRWRLATLPRGLPEQDVERLLTACDRSSPAGLRNHAILLMLARLGLRAGEIVRLELGDVHWRQGEIVVRGKGSSLDRLPLPEDVGEALAAYLRNGRPRSSSRHVFLRARAPHRGLGHPSSVTTIVRRAFARAGLSPPTRGAHVLRHSLASSMLRRGASLAEIGQVLRHRSPNTTEIYAKLDFDALRDVALPWPTSGGAR
jgi:site-specific recombinase XerD